MTLEKNSCKDFEFYLVIEPQLDVGLLPDTLNQFFGSEMKLTWKDAWIKPCHPQPLKRYGKVGKTRIHSRICYLLGKWYVTRDHWHFFLFTHIGGAWTPRPQAILSLGIKVIDQSSDTVYYWSFAWALSIGFKASYLTIWVIFSVC